MGNIPIAVEIDLDLDGNIIDDSNVIMSNEGLEVRPVEDMLYISDIHILKVGQYSPHVFRGKLMLLKHRSGMLLCCRNVAGDLYARRLLKTLRFDIAAEGVISMDLFNRLEIFMIAGVDCLNKTI